MTGVSHGILVAESIPAVMGSRGWRRALLSSAFLHLLILSFMLPLHPDLDNRVPRATPAHRIAVVLARTPRFAEPVQQSSAASPNPVEARSQAQPQAARTPLTVVRADDRSADAPARPMVLNAILRAQEVPGADEIRAAIAEFTAGYKAGLTGDWLAECRSFQERYATRDCPGSQAEDTTALNDGQRIAEAVFAGATRYERHAAFTNSLLQQNERLDELMEEGGVLGSLARERYYLNREYVFYLNGNFNFQAWNFVKTSNASNGNLEFMRGFMQFQCKESPCVYEFTGAGEKSGENTVDVIRDVDLP